ncbi:hypothetical protein Tco_0287588 [Tanacetum coccineum]
MMSSPNHPTSDIEDAFSSNFPDYIPVSPDYVLASPGNTYSSSLNNSFGLVPKASPTLSLFHDDPSMKVMQVYYAKESPIPPPNIMPPSSMLSPIKQMGNNNKIALARFRIANLEKIIKDIQVQKELLDLSAGLSELNQCFPVATVSKTARTSTYASSTMTQAAIRKLVTDRTPSLVYKMHPTSHMNLHCQVSDLQQGATPVTQAPYRLAPSEIQELSNQLQELADRGTDIKEMDKIKTKPDKNEHETERIHKSQEFASKWSTKVIMEGKPDVDGLPRPHKAYSKNNMELVILTNIQIQPPQYSRHSSFPVIHHPPQATDTEMLQARENLMETIQSFLNEYDHIPPEEKCMALLLAKERFLKIKQAVEEEQNQPEVMQELLLKLMNDLQILNGIQPKQAEQEEPAAQSFLLN